MGLKAADSFTVPLCGPCHNHWHAVAYLPCHEWRLIAGPILDNQQSLFALAHARSVALVFQTQAKLLGARLQAAETF